MNKTISLKKALSLVLAMLMLFSLAIPAFAAEEEPEPRDDAVTTIALDGTTDVTIDADGDYYIEMDTDVTTHTGQIIIADEVKANITIDSVVIESADSAVKLGNKSELTLSLFGEESKLAPTGAGAFGIELAENNKLIIQKSADYDAGTPKLIVAGADGDPATGTYGGAGIGANNLVNSSIKIAGVDVKATGGEMAPGIGAIGDGELDSKSSITIDSATVVAEGGSSAAGIGAANLAGNITINSSKVTATGGAASVFDDEVYPGGAGIGTGGFNSVLTGKISIKKTSKTNQTTATGGDSIVADAKYALNNASAGPGIGDQGSTVLSDGDLSDKDIKFAAYEDWLKDNGYSNKTKREQFLKENPTIPYFAAIDFSLTSSNIITKGGTVKTAKTNSKRAAGIGTGGTLKSYSATTVSFVNGIERQDEIEDDDEPAITTFTASPTTLGSNGGSSKITIKGENLPASFKVAAFLDDSETTIGNSDVKSTDGINATCNLTFPANSDTKSTKQYTIKASFEDDVWYSGKSASVEVSEASKTPIFALPVMLKPGANVEQIELTADLGNGRDYTYQWYRNDILLVGETNANLIVEKSGGDGIYHVRRTLSGTATLSNKCTVKWQSSSLGTVAIYATKDSSSPVYSISSADALESAVLTATEKQDVKDNADVTYAITISMTTITNESSTNSIAARNIATSAGYLVGMYVDIAIKNEKYVSNTLDIIKDVTALSSEITLQIAVPDNLQKTGRKFEIIRVHNGDAEFLDNENSSPSTHITFKSDKFSTYALVYKETGSGSSASPSVSPKSSGTPSTGDGSNIWIWLVVAAVSLMAAAVILVVMHNQNKKNHSSDK